MTYTTLRYLIVLGLLFNALVDVNCSEEADAPRKQAEGRSPLPPFGPNPHIGVYNQPNPAPILQANSPYLAPPPQQVGSSSSQTPPVSPKFSTLASPLASSPQQVGSSSSQTPSVSPKFSTLASSVFLPRPIHPSAESEYDRQLNSPSPPFGLATDHISVHNGSAETLHVPVIYKEYAEEALQEMSCTVNMQEATKKATILKEKILGFLKGCATKPGTIDLSKNNVDMDIRSFIAHYCFPRFNGIDREKAKKRYFFYNCDHFSPYLFIALQGFVDRQGLKKFAAIALLIGNDSSFLEAVDQQIDRIKGELLSKKESFFKTLADARSAVCQYTTEKKLNLDHVKHQNYSRSFDNLPPLYDNEIKEVTGILERRGLLKKDEYGSAICNMASEHFGRYSTEVSIFEIFFLSRYGI